MWSMHLADTLVRVSSRRSLELGALALTIDGVFVLFEGWSLRRGFRWAPWLVVVATAALLPFEIFEILRRVRAGRVVIFLANVAVVVYLVQRRLREGRAAKPSLASAPR